MKVTFNFPMSIQEANEINPSIVPIIEEKMTAYANTKQINNDNIQYQIPNEVPDPLLKLFNRDIFLQNGVFLIPFEWKDSRYAHYDALLCYITQYNYLTQHLEFYPCYSNINLHDTSVDFYKSNNEGKSSAEIDSLIITYHIRESELASYYRPAIMEAKEYLEYCKKILEEVTIDNNKSDMTYWTEQVKDSELHLKELEENYGQELPIGNIFQDMLADHQNDETYTEKQIADEYVKYLIDNNIIKTFLQAYCIYISHQKYRNLTTFSIDYDHIKSMSYFQLFKYILNYKYLPLDSGLIKPIVPFDTRTEKGKKLFIDALYSKTDFLENTLLEKAIEDYNNMPLNTSTIQKLSFPGDVNIDSKFKYVIINDCLILKYEEFILRNRTIFDCENFYNSNNETYEDIFKIFREDSDVHSRILLPLMPVGLSFPMKNTWSFFSVPSNDIMGGRTFDSFYNKENVDLNNKKYLQTYKDLTYNIEDDSIVLQIYGNISLITPEFLTQKRIETINKKCRFTNPLTFKLCENLSNINSVSSDYITYFEEIFKLFANHDLSKRIEDVGVNNYYLDPESKDAFLGRIGDELSILSYGQFNINDMNITYFKDTKFKKNIIDYNPNEELTSI